MKAKKMIFTYDDKYQEKYKFTSETKIIFNSNIVELWIPETRKIGELLDYSRSKKKEGIIATVLIDEKLDKPADQYSLKADYGPEKINENNELESVRLYRLNLVQD